jgi:hypothetical protein
MPIVPLVVSNEISAEKIRNTLLADTFVDVTGQREDAVRRSITNPAC